MNSDKQTNNNSNWPFNKTSNNNNINPRMYVLKWCDTDVKIPDNDNFHIDAETFEWKYNNNYTTLDDEEFQFINYQEHQPDIFIHEFLVNNVEGQMNYNVDQFLIRTTCSYTGTHGVFSSGYQLNIMGWNKLKMNEQDPYSEVFNSNNHLLMNLMYTLAKVWLKSYKQFPHSSSYIQGDDLTTFHEDAFMNFSPDMKTYHLLDSGGSYLSKKMIHHIFY